MSDIRPLAFRKVSSAESAASESHALRRPVWLRPGSASVRPAPFTRDDAQGDVEQQVHYSEPPPPAEAVAEPLNIPAPPPMPAMRKSSLPPRRSMFPQASVSRFPPPPVPVVEEPKISAEQEAFANAALELGAQRAHMLSKMENELLGLAVHIAQTIIEREVTNDPTLHKTLARTAMLALGDTQNARLRVSRTAYKAITELYGEAAIDVDGVRVEVSMDNSLDALSVVAEAGPSRVDGRVTERLKAVLRAMEAEHRRNNADMASEEEL